MGDQNHEVSDVNNSDEKIQGSLQCLNSFNSSSTTTADVSVGGCDHLIQHLPCTSCGCSGSNSLKRRSASSCPSLQDPSSTVTESGCEPRAKKHFCQQEDLTPHRSSTMSLPLSLGTLPANQNAKPCPVLRRCISDPWSPTAAPIVGFPATPCHSPENINGVSIPATPSSIRGSASASGLPPLPRSLKRCVSDLTPSSTKTFSRSSCSGAMGIDLTREQTPNFMRLRRMKDRIREMRQWWDKVMEKEEEQDDHEGAEDNKVPSEDDCGGNVEEAVKVQWAEKCLSINFKCPCSKGYQILLSENNCYYKLV